MFLKTKGKKKYIWSALTLSLAGVVTVGTVLETTQTAMAKPTLPGVEKIIQDNSNENPFVILEIVPDTKDASLGFFVDGEEPVDDSGRSIKDMPSMAEREARFATDKITASDKISTLGITNALSYEEYKETDQGSKKADIRGVFENVTEGGDYKETDPSVLYSEVTIADEEQLKAINRSGITLFRKYTSYRVPENGAGEGDNTYKIELKELDDTENMPVLLEDGTYNEQYFVAEEINVGDILAGELEKGDLIFRVDDDELLYVGMLESGDPTNMVEMETVTEEETTEEETTSEEETTTEEPSTSEESSTEETSTPEETSSNEEDSSEEESSTSQEEASTPEESSSAEEPSTPEEGQEVDVTPEEPSDAEVMLGASMIGKMKRMSINLGELDFDSGITYVKVEEADGDDDGPYYYISSVETSGGDMSSVISFGEVIRPNGGYPKEVIGKTFYTRNDNSLPYDYDPITGTYRFKADYTQEVYDTVSYDGGFTNKEWFKKSVFDLDSDELKDMSIDVVPVAMSDLTEELLEKADLIYFSDAFDTGFSSEEVPEDDGKWMVQFTFDDDVTGFSDSGAKIEKFGNPSIVDVDGRKAVYLDGTDDFLKVMAEDGSSLLTGVSELTISFDIKTAEYNRTDWGFFAAPNEATQSYQQEHYIGIFEQYAAVNVERYNNSGARPEWIRVENSMPTNVWTNVTAVFKEGECTLYVNGSKMSTLSSDYSLESILGNESILQIGKGNWVSGEYSKSWIDNYTIANYDLISEKTIYERVIEKAGGGVPVVLNRSLYENEGNAPVIRKMAACLMHGDVTAPFGGSAMDGASLETLGLADLADSMKQPLSDTESLTYVNGNIFVYDDIKNSEVVSSDFHKEIFEQAEIEYGFTDLLEEIQNENFYLEVAGKDERIEEKVTMATAIRYIINFGDRRNVTKTSLRVLDLEPYDFEEYYTTTFEGKELAYVDIRASWSDLHSTVNTIETDSICLSDGKLDKERWIIDNLAPQFADNRDELDVTIMGTREFVGNIEDINEQYDLIYLGMDTSLMNTQINTVSGKKVKTDETLYNDSSMNGLVYTHVGDKYTLNSGIISNTNNRYIRGDYRMSGNDITFDKVRELTEYIEAGYAVIVSDEMLKKDGDSYKVNTDKIDSASNMYKLLDEVILLKKDGKYRYFGKNVNVKSAFESGNSSAVANREVFSRYMGISKLVLEYSQGDLPVAYDESDGIADYLSMDADGLYYSRYKIKMKNDAAVEATKTTYNCKLYVDIDADGRYEEGEVLTGLDITGADGSGKMPDENGKYHLRTGDTYSISRSVPEGYTGFIAWKLVFEQNDQEFDGVSERALVRSSIEGYSAVPHSGNKPLIKVLQITNQDGKTNLDLQNDAYMKSLYNDAKLDFEIEVSKMSSREFMSRTTFASKTYVQFLKEFDMLVMGFYDSYMIAEGTDNLVNDADAKEAMLAIREYALSGRSILFTHDLSGFNLTDDSEKNWSWYANRYLRDIQGMDRFGVMSEYNTIPNEDKYKYGSKYDTTSYKDSICKNDGTEEKSLPMALNNILLANSAYKKASLYGETARAASSFMQWSNEYVAKGSAQGLGAVAVAQVNRGQITEYPYKISDNFNVSGTHGQYMQLNLDTDSRDEYTNDDIVVWYTLDKRSDLTDSIYAAVEKDVRNSYFIFNKGNITYTGSGHRKVESEEEKRLFLNTLVASYRTGMHAPRALFKENEWETSATINSQYIPYDPEVNDGNGGFLDEALPVHFYTTNVNLQKTNELLYAKYYIDGTSASYDLYMDGRYYKEVTPVSAKRMVEENGALKAVDEQPSRLTNNSMHTVTFSYADIGLGNSASIRDKYSTNIYVRLGYEELEQAGTNGETALPATESISKLNIVCTQLFELR